VHSSSHSSCSTTFLPSQVLCSHTTQQANTMQHCTDMNHSQSTSHMFTRHNQPIWSHLIQLDTETKLLGIVATVLLPSGVDALPVTKPRASMHQKMKLVKVQSVFLTFHLLRIVIKNKKPTEASNSHIHQKLQTFEMK